MISSSKESIKKIKKTKIKLNKSLHKIKSLSKSF